MENQFVRKLIAVEIKLGFLSIPAYGMELMPDKKIAINVDLDGGEKQLSYNPQHRRIFGLTSWYKKHAAKAGDEVSLTKIGENRYSFSFGKGAVKSQTREKEGEEFDLSGLSSQAKGNIVEDRVKELLLLHGQGLLSVYRPVTDTEGIDLIIVKNGQFHPIFLQSKGRFGLYGGRSLILRIKVKTFTPHENFYVIGSFFDPKTLEIHDNLVLIPSEEIAKASTVKTKNGEWYNVVASVKDNSGDKWAKYLVKKTDLADKLLGKFEEIGRYVK